MEIDQARGELTHIAEQYREEMAVLTGSLVRLLGIKEQFINLHGGEIEHTSSARSVLNFAENILHGDFSVEAAIQLVGQAAVQVEHYRDNHL